MRWFLVAILAYACLLVQTALFRPGALALELDDHWARPDLVLTLGLFLALYLRPTEAFVLAWCLGLASDLVSVAGRVGLLALLFCLSLLPASHLRRAVPRDRLLAQFLAALATVFVVHWLWYVAARGLAGSSLALGRSAEEAVFDALYSAALAPYLFILLRWLRSPLRLKAETER